MPAGEYYKCLLIKAHLIRNVFLPTGIKGGGEMGTEKTLLSVDEFCDYMGIGKTKARELISNPSCKYVVRVGRRVLIHKELLDAELKKSAKFQLKM